MFENGQDDVVEVLRECVCCEVKFEMVTSETANGLFSSYPQGSKNYNKRQNQKQKSVPTHFGQHENKSLPGKKNMVAVIAADLMEFGIVIASSL